MFPKTIRKKLFLERGGASLCYTKPSFFRLDIFQDYYCDLSPIQTQLYEDFAKSQPKEASFMQCWLW